MYYVDPSPDRTRDGGTDLRTRTEVVETVHVEKVYYQASGGPDTRTRADVVERVPPSGGPDTRTRAENYPPSGPDTRTGGPPPGGFRRVEVEADQRGELLSRDRLEAAKAEQGYYPRADTRTRTDVENYPPSGPDTRTRAEVV